MNKRFVFMALACLLVLKSNMVIFAQNSNDEQRLVGTWTFMHNDESTLVFNANGTMSSGIALDGFMPTHWAAAGDRLLVFTRDANWNKNRAIRYFHISSDGKTLIISTIAVEGAGSTGSIGGAYRRK